MKRIEEQIEEDLEVFNAGPTNGTLNDKRRAALIYEALLEIKYRTY